MSKKTAVQWLYDELSHCLHREEVCDLVYKLEQKAKQMETEQIIDAYYYDPNCDEIKDDGEQYYNDTYGGKDESNH